jgi:hypothetical protein
MRQFAWSITEFDLTSRNPLKPKYGLNGPPRNEPTQAIVRLEWGTRRLEWPTWGTTAMSNCRDIENRLWPLV